MKDLGAYLASGFPCGVWYAVGSWGAGFGSFKEEFDALFSGFCSHQAGGDHVFRDELFGFVGVDTFFSEDFSPSGCQGVCGFVGISGENVVFFYNGEFDCFAVEG